MSPLHSLMCFWVSLGKHIFRLASKTETIPADAHAKIGYKKQ